jgi:alkylated DNA nucleotide flippase Atl1
MDVGEEIRAMVVAIPAGCVATYGEIGLAVGIGPRQAGRAVSLLDDDVPWWRVVYANGTPVTCHDGAARALRKAEGVPFLNGRLDMAQVKGHRPRPNTRESSTVDFG